MQNKVIFNDGQDVDPTDFTNLQQFTQDSFDTLIADTVSPVQRYAGLAVTKNGSTSVNVASGRLYSSGKVFSLVNPVTQDFLTSLPIAGQKIVTMVIYGSEIDTDVTAREFLINETTGQSQPKPVATRHSRVCNIQFAYGTEAPSPIAPLISVGYTAVADILLTTTGVFSITMRDNNRAGNLDDLDDRVDNLEIFEGVVGPKVTSLSSDLAALSGQLSASASSRVVAQLLTRIAVIEAKSGIPQDSVSSRANYFLDDSGLDLANPLSNCRREEGIRFPEANKGQSRLGLLNPLDINAKVINGLLLPNYTRSLWQSTGNPSDQVRLSGYSYQTNTLVQKSMSRQVVRYGTEFSVCTNSAFWASGNYDALSGIFTRNDGATFKAQFDPTLGVFATNQDGPSHIGIRIQQYWTDTVSETYWDTVTNTTQVNGSVVAESWLQGQDIWLDAVGLFFTKLADTGGVTVAICEVSSFGLPDLTKIISTTNVPRQNLQIAPTETVVSLTPTFLSAGKRYATLVITAADHWAATVPGEQFTQGTFFYILDGAYAQGDGTRDLQMNLYRAVPNSPRTTVTLNPLQLDGGILGIKINADAVTPSQCNLSYEIQVAGVWYPFSSISDYTLGQGGAVLPLLPFRVTMVGSGDMMPAVNLTTSEVTVTRPATSLTAIGSVETLPSGGSAAITIIQRYESWNSTYHTAMTKLLTGSNYATSTNPSSFSDVTGVDPSAGPYLERTYVYNLSAPVTSFKVRTDMSTSSNRIITHVAFQKDYEL